MYACIWVYDGGDEDYEDDDDICYDDDNNENNEWYNLSDNQQLSISPQPDGIS